MSKKGKAIVTGASSGIGKIYADRLAKSGYDIVLVARRAEKLDVIAAELRETHKVQVESLVADLATHDGVSAVEFVISTDPLVTFLVNNAGTSTLGSAAEASVPDQEAMINVNIVALTRLSVAAAAQFKARNTGTIINIGSVLGFASLPISGIYSGTKGYVLNFTRALQDEFNGTGVTIQLVAPAATATEIWELSGVPLSNLDPAIVMTVEDCVDASLQGLQLGEAVSLPSIEDQGLLTAYDEARAKLLIASQTGRPASRYSLPR